MRKSARVQELDDSLDQLKKKVDGADPATMKRLAPDLLEHIGTATKIQLDAIAEGLRTGDIDPLKGRLAMLLYTAVGSFTAMFIEDTRPISRENLEELMQQVKDSMEVTTEGPGPDVLVN